MRVLTSHATNPIVRRRAISHPAHMARRKKPQQGRVELARRRFYAEQALRTCEELFLSGVFDHPSNSTGVQHHAAVTLLLVSLADLCRMAWDAGCMLEPEEPATGPGVEDFHDLAQICRDAACHIGSHYKLAPPGIWLDLVTLTGVGRMTPDLPGCEYPDDTALIFGPYRLYIGRHAVSAVKAARSNFDRIWPRDPLR